MTDWNALPERDEGAVTTPRAVFLTGAAGGLGQPLARRLAHDGHALALCDGSPEVLELAADLRACGAEAIGIQYDVSDADAAQSAHEQAREAIGPPTAIVTAAAIVDQVQRSWRFTPQMWRRELDVNLSGAFYALAPALPTLREHGGRVVVVSSVGALTGLGGQVAYAATKAGLLGMVRTLAQELGPSGATVNAVLPGAIATPKFEAMPGPIRDRARDAIPLRRFAEPAEVADLVSFLLSARASYINGASIVIDGGLSLGNLTFGSARR